MEDKSDCFMCICMIYIYVCCCICICMYCARVYVYVCAYMCMLDIKQNLLDMPVGVCE